MDEGFFLGGVAVLRGGGGVVRLLFACARRGQLSWVEDFGEDAAVEVVGEWDAEEFERGGGDVEECGGGVEACAWFDGGSGGDEDAFHAVVAGGAERGRDDFMGGEVVESDGAVGPVFEDDGEVWREVGMGTVVELVALVDLLDEGPPCLGVQEGGEPCFDLVEHGVGVGGVDAAVGLSSLEVEEDLAEVAL